MKATILLVDDDLLVLHTLASGLSEAGYHILEADSGEMAMELCTENNCPDLALLDMRMNGMSGIDFAQWLKSTLDVPFLFLSAYNDQHLVESAADLGALGYLVQPLDMPQILPTIHTSLHRAEEIKRLLQAELDLSTALKTNRCISMSVGLLMQRYQTGADETFDALRAYCRSHRKRIVEVSERIIHRKEEIDLTPHLSSVPTLTEHKQQID